jgi:2,5-dihydroxypyridine 5,6-dioxygenase
MATSQHPSEMIALFRQELELCGVKAGERVAVLSEMGQQTAYVSAFMTAARELGGEVFNVNLLPADGPGGVEKLKAVGQTALAGNRSAIAALKSADMVIDLMFLLFSKEQLEIQAAGTRVLLVAEPFEILSRLFPSRELRARVEAGEARLAKAKHLRFTNPAGTDVTYELGQYPILTEYGFTDTPGRWDHWPGGFLATQANDGKVNGKVVMDKGDILFPEKTYVQSPIEFTIRDGYVVEITGGRDAALLREYAESFHDPRAYAISHIGWGLNHLAQWEYLASGKPTIGMDGRACYGNVLFSTGPNVELGGTNDTPCHLDLPMKGCTLYLDDELIVKNGDIIPKDMRAPGRY